MQVVSLASPSVASGKPRGAAVERLRSEPLAAPSQSTVDAADPIAVPRGGLRAWNVEINQQVAGAQQALGFLDDLAGQVREVMAGLGSHLLAREPAGSAQLSERIERVDSTWRGRHAASGGTLDSRLGFKMGEPAVQRFTVRGLDLRTLRSAERETLSFWVGAGRPRPDPVQLEPGLSDEELVHRLDQSLSAAGIRVAADHGDALVFTMPESAWLAVRESLAIKGGGIRFPTGQFNRVRTDEQPQALEPGTWKADDPSTLRQTLDQVLNALDIVRHARDGVERALAEAGRQLDRARPAEDPAWAKAVTANFKASLADAPAYEVFGTITGALHGMRRERVLSLLALR